MEGSTTQHVEDRYGGKLRLWPGFHFHPHDFELIFFLKTKRLNRFLTPCPIHDLQIHRYSPQRLYEMCGVAGSGKMYFFTKRKTNRSNEKEGADRGIKREGQWKRSGDEIEIKYKGRKIGSKRGFDYYINKNDETEKKTEWRMHEYLMSKPENAGDETGWEDIGVYEMYNKEWKNVEELVIGKKVCREPVVELPLIDKIGR